MIQMTDDQHNELIGKMSLLKGHLQSLRGKYAMLRATQEYADAVQLANQIHDDLLTNYETVEEKE